MNNFKMPTIKDVSEDRKRERRNTLDNIHWFRTSKGYKFDLGKYLN